MVEGEKMIRFEIINQEQYDKDTREIKGAHIRTSYDNLKLPTRSTEGSAGYDFYSPVKIVCRPNEWYTIPTGIKFVTDRKDIVLLCAPRSGLGCKKHFQLLNTIGVIDSDYQYADNDGHIMIKFMVEKELTIETGDKIIQGIIVPYLTVDDDETVDKRTGGFGSTGK